MMFCLIITLLSLSVLSAPGHQAGLDGWLCLVCVFVGLHIKNISPNYPRDVLQMFDKRNMTITRSSAAARPVAPAGQWWPGRVCHPQSLQYGPQRRPRPAVLFPGPASPTTSQTNWKIAGLIQPSLYLCNPTNSNMGNAGRKTDWGGRQVVRMVLVWTEEWLVGTKRGVPWETLQTNWAWGQVAEVWARCMTV